MIFRKKEERRNLGKCASCGEDVIDGEGIWRDDGNLIHKEPVCEIGYAVCLIKTDPWARELFYESIGAKKEVAGC